MIALILLATLAATEGELVEQFARKYDCQAQVAMSDGTECDLLPNANSQYAGYAIEADFPSHWAESVTQAEHYATLTNRKPAVLVFVRSPAKEYRALSRMAWHCGRRGVLLIVEDASEKKVESVSNWESERQRKINAVNPEGDPLYNFTSEEYELLFPDPYENDIGGG